MPQLIREHRWLETQEQKALLEMREAQGFPPHVAPFSVLVVCVGNHYEPGVFDAIREMCDYTHAQGPQVTLYEQPDLCFNWGDALGTMRNEAMMKALSEGYEFLLYVDNDVIPPREALWTMMRKYVGICLPIPEYADGEHHNLSVTRMERNAGMAMVRSSIISFVLFKTAVFESWRHIPFWENALGAHEEYHFNRLRAHGHQPFVDTSVVVKILKPPHFPLEHKPQPKGNGLWTPN